MKNWIELNMDFDRFEDEGEEGYEYIEEIEGLKVYINGDRDIILEVDGAIVEISRLCENEIGYVFDFKKSGDIIFSLGVGFISLGGGKIKVLKESFLWGLSGGEELKKMLEVGK